MSCADKSYSLLNTVAGPVPLRLWPKWLAAVWREVHRALELRRQRRALLELDDRQLKDIGVTRQQALSEANKLFWPRA